MILSLAVLDTGCAGPTFEQIELGKSGKAGVHSRLLSHLPGPEIWVFIRRSHLAVLRRNRVQI